jgi:uncharacterized OsmC-like protein
MAVYQGARLRTDALQPAEVSARRVRSAAAAPAAGSLTPRVRPMGLLMAAIMASTIVGLVYLTQTLGTNAASTEIDQLEVQRNKLIQEIKRHEIVALDMTQAEVVVPKARDQKLKRLGDPLVLPAP